MQCFRSLAAERAITRCAGCRQVAVVVVALSLSGVVAVGPPNDAFRACVRECVRSFQTCMATYQLPGCPRIKGVSGEKTKHRNNCKRLYSECVKLCYP